MLRTQNRQQGTPLPWPRSFSHELNAAVAGAALSALTFRNFSTRSCLAGSGPMRTFSYLRCTNERAASNIYLPLPFGAEFAGRPLPSELH